MCCAHVIVGCEEEEEEEQEQEQEQEGWVKFYLSLIDYVIAVLVTNKVLDSLMGKIHSKLTNHFIF